MDEDLRIHIQKAIVEGDNRLKQGGNPAKARAKLGWEPTVNFRQLVEMMVDADLERLRGRR